MSEPREKVEELRLGLWEKSEAKGVTPSPRNGHACVVVGDKMYLYGGGTSSEDGEASYLSDMFSLSFKDGALHWEIVEQSGDLPSAREGATLNAVEGDLFLFGGTEAEGVYTCAEGLFVFQTGVCVWLRKETSGAAPQALSLTGVVCKQQLITFGGVLKGKAVNDLHILSFPNMSWAMPETTGTPPLPRCDHACCVVGHRVYVTGGSGSESLWFNDLHFLNVDTLAWEQVALQGPAPAPRDYTAITSLCNWYLGLFGGFNGSSGNDECFSDLHFLDLTQKSLSWRPVELSPAPPQRYGHTLVVLKKKLLVFGGQDLEQELNDLWTLSVDVPMSGFEPTPTPRSRYNLATPIPTPRKVITPAPPKTVQPRDFEELRSGYVKRINEMFDTLAERFQQLDGASATLESERAAFEAEKKAHNELYERQQQELKEMFDSHRQQNEEWVERMRAENDRDRRALAEERARLEKAGAELAADQEAFQQRSKKLDAIMKQVQGLST